MKVSFMLYMTKRSQIFLVPPPQVSQPCDSRPTEEKQKPKKQKQNKKGQTLVVSAPL